MISVVMPTLDRRPVLQCTLAALAAQKAPGGGFEVIVIDNGSADDTLDALDDLQRDFPVPLTVLSESVPGPAAARNAGVRAAKGEIVLFLGDDMEPAGDAFLLGHARYHERYREPEWAVVGGVVWNPRTPITPFMRWLESSGPQFNFRLLSAGRIPAHYFYTSNVSVKRDLLLKVGGFDIRFPYAAVEDTEIGTRLALSGMQLVYDPDLVVLHDHPQQPRAWASRMEKVGQSANLYNALWPDYPLKGLPRPDGPLFRVSRATSSLFAAISELPIGMRLRGLAWQVVHLASYARGYRNGPPEPPPRQRPRSRP